MPPVTLGGVIYIFLNNLSSLPLIMTVFLTHIPLPLKKIPPNAKEFRIKADFSGSCSRPNSAIIYMDVKQE